MNKFQALFMGFATAAGAGGIAAYNGVFDKTPATQAAVSSAAAPAVAEKPADKTADKPVAVAKADPAAPMAAAEPEKPAVTVAPAAAVEPAAPADAAKAAAGPAAPAFGLLQVKPDGSVLVAGQGAPDAMVELLTGSTVLGKTKAESNGDFAIVLDVPLKPGDYQMVLRATATDGTSATSVETATVEIPENANGPVLALVDQPGKPSRIITSSAPEKNIDVAIAAPAADAAAPAAEAAKPAEIAKADPAAVAPEAKAAEPATESAAAIGVEAIEIEGRKIFVAGRAAKGSTVRITANDIVLGETKATQDGRFLLEVERDLPVGDYIVHAETLAANGTVMAKAAVPFKREAGEALTAVAEAAPKEAAPAAEAPAAAVAAAEPAAETSEAAPAVAAADAQTAKPAPGTAEIVATAEVKPAAETADATAPALKKADASVIIRRGDSLWKISRRIYGRGIRYSTIYQANKSQVADPNRIWPGWVMMIPEKTPEGEAADMVEVEKRKSEASAQ